jgi:hypothetical protein
MRTCALAILGLLVPVLALGQPQGIIGPTWQWQRSDTSAVFIDAKRSALLVWRVAESGQCSVYPSRIEWEDGDLIQASSGNRWEMEREGDRLRITFPQGVTIEYEVARVAPAARCGVSQDRET